MGGLFGGGGSAPSPPPTQSAAPPVTSSAPAIKEDQDPTVDLRAEEDADRRRRAGISPTTLLDEDSTSTSILGS